MDIVLANPRGFCAGVDRAIEIVKRALETLGAPIYVRHEVVHNRFVVDDLKHRGAVFVEELDEVPDNATVIFSAHGVSQAVRQEAARRGLKVFDATCPLVTKVHLEVARQCRAGRDMVLIGHAGHPEVEGTMGQWNAQAGTGRIYLIESIDDVARTEILPVSPETLITPGPAAHAERGDLERTAPEVDAFVLDGLRHEVSTFTGCRSVPRALAPPDEPCEYPACASFCGASRRCCSSPRSPVRSRAS